MRITLVVKTMGKAIKDVRSEGISQLDKYIKKLTQPCPECSTLFLPEKRTRKKYCGDYCRSKASARAALERYHKRKKKKQQEGKI